MSAHEDDLNIEVNFGDGVEKATKVGENSIPLFDPDITRLRLGSGSRSGASSPRTPTPSRASTTARTRSSDWGGGTDFDTFTVEVTGAQQITFPAVGRPDLRRPADAGDGQRLSGVPVTYDAGPGSVCQATGENGQAVQLVGVGECTVTAHQAADPPLFLAAAPVSRTFDVTPAPLTIKAAVQGQGLRCREPRRSPRPYTRLVNGDTPDDITGLVFDGPPAGADVGDYAITRLRGQRTPTTTSATSPAR